MANGVATAKRSWLAAREEFWGFAFIAPFLILFFVFRVMPALMAIWLSIDNWQPTTGETTFVGLSNFDTLIHQANFWKAMLNTFYYAVLVTPSGLILALMAAAFIHALPWRGLREFFQGAYYLPGVIAAVAVAVLWRYIYDYEVGLLNFLVTTLGFERVNWLGDPRVAMISVALMEVLIGLGGTIIIFVAALGGIPQDVYDAAKIDGAVAWQEFVYVTLPLLTPAILYVAVVRTIGAFQVFVPIYLLTLGGPANATLTVGFLIYRQVFYYGEVGMATATGLLLLVATLIFTVFQFRWFSSVVEY